MKKSNILALTMLIITTSGIIMDASCTENHTTYNFNKKRNNNTYDGSQDACEGRYLDNNDGYESYDEKHHLNKKRNSHEHPICSCGKNTRLISGKEDNDIEEIIIQNCTSCEIKEAN